MFFGGVILGVVAYDLYDNLYVEGELYVTEGAVFEQGIISGGNINVVGFGALDIGNENETPDDIFIADCLYMWSPNGTMFCCKPNNTGNIRCQ